MGKRRRKHKKQTIKHRDVTHHIYGRAIPGSAAEYLLLKLRYLKMDDTWMLRHFKKGEQLLFNTKFIEGVQETHQELHCELCGKENLKLYYWWENGNRKIMATADHFFPKSHDKEKLSFEIRNMIVACDSCNNNKADDFYGIDTIKFPYPGTIENIEELAEELGMNRFL